MPQEQEFQLSPESEGAFERAFGTQAPTELSPESERAFDQAFPDTPMDVLGDVPNAVAKSTDLMQATTELEQVSPNLSLIDDFRPKIQEAAKGLLRAKKTDKGLVRTLGAAASQVPSDLFTSEDILAHAASAGLGDVWSVAKDPRSKSDWYRTGVRRAANFMKLSGFDRVAGPEEAAEITAAYLFGELAIRTPMHRETMGKVNLHTIKSLVAEKRAEIAMQASGGLPTADPAFFNAAAYLDGMTEEEAIQLRGLLARHSKRIPQNEQEALLAKQVDDVVAWDKWDFANPPRQDQRSAALARNAAEVLLGAEPDEGVLNRMERTEAQWKLKDLGFIQGDLLKPGVQIPNAMGGFVDTMLIPNETLSKLQRRKRELGIITPFEAGPDLVKEYITDDLDAENAKKLTESIEAVLTATAAGGAALRDDRVAAPEEMTPAEWDNLPATQKIKARAYGLFGKAFDLVRQPLDAWREAQRGKLGGMLGQMGVQLLTGREDLARESDDMLDVISTAASLVGQYNDLDALQAERIRRFKENPQRAALMQAIGLGPKEPRGFGETTARALMDPDKVAIMEEIPAMKEVDSKLSSEILSEFGAANTWARNQSRDDIRREDEKRQGRMSAWERGFPQKGYGTRHYIRDFFFTGAHAAWEGLGATVAQVIDDPQLLPLVLAADRVGDRITSSPVNALRNATKAALHSRNALGSMRQILQYSGEDVARLRRIATEKVAASTTQEGAVTALRDLAAASAELEEQWAGVRRGGKGPGRDTIERVATLWRDASRYGADFNSLDTLVERMIPQSFGSQLMGAIRSFRAKAPITMTKAGLEGLSRSYREMANRILPSLGRAPMDLTDAVDLERRGMQGDEGAIQELVRRQTGYNRNLGLTEQIEMGAELESLYGQLRNGERIAPGRFEEIRTRLWGSADMSDLDWATLVQLQDAGRWGKRSRIMDWIAKRRGYSADQLVRLQGSGKTILDFASNEAKDYYLAKFNNELVSMRRGRAYEYAKQKVRHAMFEAELEGDQRAYAAGTQRIAQLEVEARRSLENPVSEAFTLDDGKMLMQTLNDGDLGYVVEYDPVLFGGAMRSDFKGRGIRELFETRDLKTDLTRTQVLNTADAVETMRDAAKRGRMDVVAEKAAVLAQGLEGKVDKTLQDIPEFEAIAKEPNAMALLKFDMDSFGAAGMPFWALSRHFQEIPRRVAYRQAVDFERLSDLHDKLETVRSTLSPEENALLDKTLAKRGPLTFDPALEHAMEMANPDGHATRARNVRQLIEGSEKFRADKINDMWELGMIDDAMKAELLAKGYDPHVMGLYETSKVIRGAQGKDAKGMALVKGQDLSTLQFQKSLTHWRVRVREADGFIRDHRFAKESRAKAWIRRTYGAEAASSLVTPSGDKIVLAAPLDAETRHVLGLVEGMTPEAQLYRLQNLDRDINLNLFLRSLRPTGLVVSPREFNRAFMAEGPRQGELKAQFLDLPNDKLAFGDLAGWKVHRKVFAELTKASHSFDQFRSWQEGLANIYRSTGALVPDELVNATPNVLQTAYRISNRAAKTALILNNLPVWASNVLFNGILTHLVDGKIFSAENRAELALAFRETFGAGKGGIVGRPETYGGRRSAEWLEFVEQGFGTSSAFEADIPASKIKSDMRMLGLDTAERLRTDIRKYEGVLAGFHEALKRGEKPALLERVQNQLVDLRAALDHHERGFAKKFGEKMMGYMFMDRDLFRRPTNAVAAEMKRLYGSVDDFFKFANYLSLKKRFGAERAAWEIRQHFQDYSRVPFAISSSANNPLGALVPSFGYELFRIGGNLMKNHPLRFTALMSIVPALNHASEMAAGMTSDRVDAFLHQAGHRNAFERFKSYFTELRVWDPLTHRPVVSTSLATALPFANMFEGRGALAQAAEEWFPEEDRGIAGGIAATGLEAIGLFAGNNPLLNTLGVMFFNRDPVTGQQVIDRNGARPKDYMKAFMKHTVRNYVPRWAYFGLEDLPASLSAPVDPTTGRNVGATSPLELLSAQMGVRIKGLDGLLRSRGVSEGHPLGRDEALVKSVVYSVVGGGSGAVGRPEFGVPAEIRELMARRDDPLATPEQKKAYDESIKSLLKKERTVSIPGQDVKLTTTEREELMRFEALERRGLPQAIAMATPEETAAIMIWLDRAGVSDKNLAEIARTILRTPLNRPRFERDPESMDRAVKMLDEHLRDKTSSAELGPVREWWRRTRLKASGLERRRRLRNAVRSEQ